jgi:ureidoacrylate peracid hydrolase
MADLKNIDFSKTALLTIDLQNDFLHPDGAYGRANQKSDDIAALPERIVPIVRALRKRGGTYISAQFTIVPSADGEPLIAPHLKQLRPFLAKGDFNPGGWGHTVVDVLAPADFVIEKIAYSAFYQTRLEYIMRASGIRHLIVGGIVTNGGVASTLRDAHLRNIETIMLTDGCAAFKKDVHEATLLSLGTVTHQMSCNDLLVQLKAAS